MRDLLPGFFISLLFFIALVLTLPSYGVHEDNLFHFMRGQYFLQKLTGKTQFESTPTQSPVFYVPGQRISLYKQNPPEEFYAPVRSFGKQAKELKYRIGPSYDQNLRSSFYKHNVWGKSVWEESPDQGHPPVSDILMAATNRIFFEKLGVVGDIEGYYVYIAFVSTLSVFFVYIFTKKIFGQTAAILASITLALFPFYFSESHFNTKDTVQMSFFTGALVSLYFFVIKKGSHRWLAAFILFAFLALGTKWNIAFLPFIFLPWLFLVRKREKAGYILRFPQVFLYSALGIFIPFILLILAWPYLWTDTWAKLIDTFNFYRQLSVIDPRIDSPPPFTLPLGFNPTPLLRVITMTPPFTLALFLIGIFLIVSRKVKLPGWEEWLILLWLCVPFLRVSRQLVDTAGSIRHFIEFLPAFAIIAGIGANYLIQNFQFSRLAAKRAIFNFQSKHNFKFLKLLFIILYSLFLILPIVRTHPNENIYFNVLARGFSGAWESGLYSWKASYDNVYRQGAVWMNKHAPQNAKLAYLDGTMLAISPVWLRDDIYFGSYFSGFEQKGEYVVSLVYPNPPSVFAYNYLDRFLEPVYEVKLDNVAVLKIWQNSNSHTKKEFQQQQPLEGTFEITKVNPEKGRVWEIHLGQSRKITRLILTVPKECLGKRGGVWSLVQNGEHKFIVPGEQTTKDGKIEIDFPAETAEIIRFWDVEGNSCLHQATVEEIMDIET